MAEDAKKYTLDALIKRREVVSALHRRQLLKTRKSSVQEVAPESKLSQCISRKNSLSDCSEVIEDSDLETEKPTKKPKLVLDSSNSDNSLNTSMISLPFAHPFFGNSATSTNSPEQDNNSKKIIVISDQIIRYPHQINDDVKLDSLVTPIVKNKSLSTFMTPSTSNANTTSPALSITEGVDTDLITATTLTHDTNTTNSILSDPAGVDTHLNTATAITHVSNNTSPVLSDPANVNTHAYTSTPLKHVENTTVLFATANEDTYIKSATSVMYDANTVKPTLTASSVIDTNLKTYLIFTHGENAANPSVSVPDGVDTYLNTATPLNHDMSAASPDVSTPPNVGSKLTIATSSTYHSNIVSLPDILDAAEHLTEPRTTNRQRNKRKVLDFLSDEDIGDYSAESSDSWCLENESESSEQETSRKKIKRVNKINKQVQISIKKKKDLKINKRKERRQKRERGQEYETKVGTVISEKKMKNNPCIPTICKRGCFDITEERRTALFNFFWKLDIQRRKDWLVRSSRIVLCARKRTDAPVSRRNVTYEYYINNGEDHQKVCQKFILNTLDISQKFLLYTLKNSKDEMAQTEQRQRHTSNKYSDLTKMRVREFIEKLPAVPSHYNRKRTNRLYLPQELKNISNLYRLYLKECRSSDVEFVSESLFRSIFVKEFNNISFHIPKKDKCSVCVKAEHNKDESEKDQKSFQEHIEEKKASYQRFKQHQSLPMINSDTVVCSFDLQKVLNTPYGDSVVLYYSRKYPIYNFTLYESGTQEVFCYLWGECDAKRGANEIATCLFSYVKTVDERGIKNLLFYCDSSSGQNKNKTVLSVLNYSLMKSTNLQVIQINYLLPGHTYMPVDSVHATIEREVKKLTVWSPTQWPSYIEAARKNPKPYNVNVMEYSDFLNWDEITTEMFTDETCKTLKMRNIKIVTLKKKNPNKIYIKYSMKEDTSTNEINLFQKHQNKQKGKGRGKGKARNSLAVPEQTVSNCDSIERVMTMIPSALYRQKIHISEAKYRDLKRLCDNGTIPKRYHNDYLKLPHGDVADTLIETDEEDKDEDIDENEASD